MYEFPTAWDDLRSTPPVDMSAFTSRMSYIPMVVPRHAVPDNQRNGVLDHGQARTWGLNLSLLMFVETAPAFSRALVSAAGQKRERAEE